MDVITVTYTSISNGMAYVVSADSFLIASDQDYIFYLPPVYSQYEVSLKKQLGPGRMRTQGGHHFV